MLFRLSTQKEVMVADIVDDQNQDYWKFQFRRDLYWESDQLQNLVQLMSAVQLHESHEEDCLQWRWSKAKSVLVRRGILDNSHNICPLCNIGEESPDHLLLLCKVARKVWDEIFVWWQMNWNCPTTFKALFLSWDSIRFKNLE
ncbi:hypothetical protein RHSIM_RhsimUnG0218600 [Rhododendron simsii]|uniref:Reverse transcriptase zinc-binding domain-containing protein n=1 Tax=Rhododendron simsii TaxID=118357 RepID=A0A834L242_RHOSS|nr:hypothetical protein RHSIM_RhsimUnG0218600 [Rhododendron simsii]